MKRHHIAMPFLAALIFSLGAISHRQHIFSGISGGTNPEPQPSALYSSRVALFNAMPGTADIVMVGDSITEQGNWRELFPTSSIINRGVGDDTAAGILERLPEIIGRKPRLVFLMLGINDLIIHRKSPQDIEPVVREIVATLRTNDIEVVMQSTLLTDNAAANEKILSFNNLLKPICKTYIDLNEVLAPNGRLLPAVTWDGIHLTGAAYLQWRDMIAQYVLP